jgi:hypothetical protein
MSNPIRNEEDAATAAIEAHTRAYGLGDPRALARAVLAAVAKFQAGQH